MQNLESLKHTIKTCEDLQSVVRTMKTLAAVNIRQYEEAVFALQDYARTIDMGLQVILSNNPTIAIRNQDSGSRIGVVLFGSDQGMCGQLNDRITQYAHTMLETMGVSISDVMALIVGTRAAGRLEDLNWPVLSGPDVPGGLDGITPCVHEILLTLDRWQHQQQVGQIMLFYSKHRAGVFLHPHMDRLLPFDEKWVSILREKSWPTRALPLTTMHPNHLFSSLVRQYLFISLFRGFAESLASENASRLRSMQNAEKNLEDRLSELQSQFSQERQLIITGELLDLVSGFESLQ